MQYFTLQRNSFRALINKHILMQSWRIIMTYGPFRTTTVMCISVPHNILMTKGCMPWQNALSRLLYTVWIKKKKWHYGSLYIDPYFCDKQNAHISQCSVTGFMTILASPNPFLVNKMCWHQDSLNLLVFSLAMCCSQDLIIYYNLWFSGQRLWRSESISLQTA